MELADPASDHVIPAGITSDTIVSGAVVETVEGGSVATTVDGTQVMVKEANVVEADVIAKNGVIHRIDTVRVPKSGVFVAPPGVRGGRLDAFVRHTTAGKPHCRLRTGRAPLRLHAFTPSRP